MRKISIILVVLLSAIQVSAHNNMIFMAPYVAPVASEPDFGAEIVRGTVYNDSEEIAITLTSGISSGNRVVVAFYCNNGSDIALTGVTDSRSNTYAVDKEGFYGELNLWIASAHVGTALQTSDTITVTINAALGNAAKFYWVGYLTNVASSSAVDQTGSQGNYGTTVSAAASTTDANTTIIGILGAQTTAYTYGSGSWTNVGDYIDTSGNTRRFQIVRITNTTNGSKDPGGAWSSATNKLTIWVAYK